MSTVTFSGPPAPPVPGQPHLGVEIVVALLREMEPGQTIEYDAIRAALNTKDPAIIYRRARSARRKLLDDGYHIVPARGVGLHRNTPAETMAQQTGPERLSMQRKARKAGKALSTIDVGGLPQDKRMELFAARTINNVIYLATRKPAAQKMLAAVKTAEKQLPMAKALEVLKNGN